MSYTARLLAVTQKENERLQAYVKTLEKGIHWGCYHGMSCIGCPASCEVDETSVCIVNHDLLEEK